MAYRIYAINNYICADNENDPDDRHTGAREDVSVFQEEVDGEDFVFRGMRTFDRTLNISDIKKADGSPYSVPEFVDFFTLNTGSSSADNSLPVGAATSANQATQISLGSDIVDLLSTGIQTMPDGGTLAPNNSTSTPLAAGGVFTGAGVQDVTGYNEIRIWVVSNVASATNGLAIQFSADGVTWITTDTYTIAANTPSQLGFGAAAQFFRVVYTNGATPQTTFFLQTILKRFGTKLSSVRPQDGRPNDNDMEENLSYAMSYDPLTNTWNRVQTQDLYISGQGSQTAVGQNIVLATAGTGSTDCIGYRSVNIQITPTGTVSSGVVTFEGSNDGTTFVPALLYDNASQIANPVSTVSPATGVTRFFSGPVHFRYFRARISTVIGGGGSLQAFTTLRQTAYQPHVYAVSQATGSSLNTSSTIVAVTPGTNNASLGKAEDAAHTTGDTGVGILVLRNDALTSNTSASGDYMLPVASIFGSQIIKHEFQHARTYSASIQFNPQAAATDVLWMPGNATTTAYVTKVIISGTAAAARLQDVQIIKRTTANTGGTTAPMLIASHDSTDSANQSTPVGYTANPTTGTASGTLRRFFAALGTAASSDDNIAVIDLGDKGRPLVLRGITQGIAINMAGTATIITDALNISIEWFETT